VLSQVAKVDEQLVQLFSGNSQTEVFNIDAEMNICGFNLLRILYLSIEFVLQFSDAGIDIVLLEATVGIIELTRC
jgi:hypothetical protein